MSEMAVAGYQKALLSPLCCRIFTALETHVSKVLFYRPTMSPLNTLRKLPSEILHFINLLFFSFLTSDGVLCLKIFYQRKHHAQICLEIAMEPPRLVALKLNNCWYCILNRYQQHHLHRKDSLLFQVMLLSQMIV